MLAEDHTIILCVYLQNKIYFEQLKLHVYKYDLLVDTLIKKVFYARLTSFCATFVRLFKKMIMYELESV